MLQTSFNKTNDQCGRNELRHFKTSPNFKPPEEPLFPVNLHLLLWPKLVLPQVTEFDMKLNRFYFIGCVNPHFWRWNLSRSLTLWEHKTQLLWWPKIRRSFKMPCLIHISCLFHKSRLASVKREMWFSFLTSQITLHISHLKI